MTIDATGLAAGQFGNVRVFLLRHDGAAGAKAVSQINKANAGAHPQHQLLGEAGDVRHDQGGSGAEFDGEVAVGHGVQRVAAHAVEAQRLGDAFAVDREGRAGQSGSAQRQAVHAFAAVLQTLGVALEHFGVSQQMVAKSNGLCHLQVGEARHDGAGVLQRDGGQRVAQLAQQVDQGVDLGAQPQADIGGDLVIARTAGVQALARIANQLDQTFFNVQVHVFQIQQPLEGAGFDFDRICVMPRWMSARSRAPMMPWRPGMSRVRERTLDVVARQALVEIHRRCVAFDEFGNRFREPGGPGLRLVGELVLIGGGSLCHDGRNYRASRGARGGGRRGFTDREPRIAATLADNPGSDSRT